MFGARQNSLALSRAVVITGLVVLLALMLFPYHALAQSTGSISGKVTDSKTGEGMPGAQILIKGTNRGAATDPDGAYTIRNVPPGTYTVFVRFIGYFTEETQVEVSSSASATANFQLRQSVLQLGEIVVTGTGAGVQKRELTTPVSTLTVQDIQTAPVQSIDQLLQGRLPGATVNLSTGMPGTGSLIRARGVTSVVASETPVIYVDGVRVDRNSNFGLGSGGPLSSSLNDILVGDIERVELLKGGAATTLYGSEAASGVLQIFTKKGKAGPPQWTFRVEQGYNQAYDQFIIEDFTKNQVIENGYFQSYSVGLTGGSENATYNFSGRMQESQGNLPNVDDILYSLNGGLRVFASEKLQLDFSAKLARDDFGRAFSDNAIAGLLTQAERGWFNPVNQASPYKGFTNEQYLAKYNDELIAPKLTEAVNRFTFSTSADYAPFKWFKHRLTVGTDYRKNEQRQFNPIISQVVTSTPGGGVSRFDREYLSITMDYAGTVNYPSTGNLTSAFTFGVQGFREEIRTVNVNATRFGLPGTDDFDNAANITAFEANQELFNGGFFFNEQLGLFNRLYLNGAVRVDGNSAFGDDVGLQVYPKAGIAYNVSDESFWQNSFLPKFWGGMKVRASWGQTGTFPSPFVKDSTFATGPFLGASAAGFGNPGNSEIKPEKTTGLDIGFDAAFLNERVGVEFTWFKETTKDALFSVPSQPVSGLAFQFRNIGEIQNDGIEVAVNASILSKPNWNVSLRASVATLDNKVTKLGGAPPFSIGGFGFLPQRVEEGKPVGVFRTIHATDDPATTARENETRLDFNPLPKRTGSVALNATLFRNLNLSILGDWQTGGYSLNTGSVLRVFDAMKPEIDRIPVGYTFSTASSVFIEKSDFFKLREVVARYQFRNVKYVRDLALTASMRNVYTFTGVDTFDPELHGVRGGAAEAGGISFFTLSPPRQFRFGIEVNY
ncbi:MAG: TonB-dependent receptor domain-containing protein [bacterium]